MAKILVIDDEREFTEMLAFRLRKQGGYETVEAYDGEEGLKLAESEQPDLILLDVMLPKLDGYEVYQRLKEQPATSAIPVIVLTASVAKETLDKFAAAGAQAYILKPFEAKELLDKISKALAR